MCRTIQISSESAEFIDLVTMQIQCKSRWDQRCLGWDARRRYDCNSSTGHCRI